MSAGEYPDLRLAGAAVGTWLAAFAGLHLSWRAGAVVGLAALVAALATVSVGTRPVSAGSGAGSEAVPGAGSDAVPGALTGVLIGVLIGVVAGAGVTACRVALRDADPVTALARERAEVRADLVVTDDPRLARGVAGRPGQYVVAADLTRLEVTGRPALRLSVRVLVLGGDPAWQGVLPGQRVVAEGRIGSARGGDLRAAVLSVPAAPRLVGRPSWAQRAAGTLRSGLQRACAPLPDEPGGLLPGLVVGDTTRLEPAVAEDFRTTGMTHLLAVSGSNVAIVLGVVLGLARWCRAGPRLAAAICAVALVGFVILVRPSPSVLRAAALGALALLALASGRPRSAVPGLAAVVIVLVLVDPQLAGEPGFALSVLATAGLLLLAPGWRDALRRQRVPAGLAEAVAVPASAQLACAPVIAALSGGVGLAAVPANLLAVPAVPPATVLGVAAALLSPVWPAGAGLAVWLASWPARWIILVGHYGAQTPAGVAPWPAGAVGGLLLAAVLAALLVAGRYRPVRRLAAVVTVAAVIGTVPIRLAAPGWPPPGWLLVVCDVGQGDAAVLPVAPGRAVVVDAGPEPAAVDGCLRRLGIREVPLLVVSHFHADHVGGVDGVFRGRRVGAVVTTAHPEPATGRRQVLAAAAAHRTPVRQAMPGERYAGGDLRLVVVGPDRTLVNTRSDPNNNSLVLRVTIGRHSLLLAGDAEEDEQQSLLGAQVRVDVLKVSHHGSAFQSPAFLDAARPAIAFVSVGVGNVYGHPNPGVLDRLARGGARVLRTDRSGDLAAVDAGGRLAVAVRGAPGGTGQRR
ncbi:ComEC/Rec2 family competence protein [Planosporangium sp. 12N6]|uniref:ComEC/Rec2 family competence protein n=1 Tax=Planosporangium spinosum TaxID=3402278 RepID=UPI003CEFE63A